ncbi:MAG: nicotinate-nucleotide--dimethylbenzimidazole phosphoribosyltransferase [Lachnospiraceae bacterium]|nr:nicotinate-nucleotide--dimethylbenzimidazole phosphoribosyltransferase [Lachnospiraceae bacterium]
MKKEDLFNIVLSKPNENIRREMKEGWDSIAKPIDSLGLLEDMIIKVSTIKGNTNISLDRKCVVVMCADNGVVEENITQSGKDVTYKVAKAMGMGESSVCTLAKACGVDVFPVDVGIDTDEKIKGVEQKKIRKSTNNFLKEPAMSEEECSLAIKAGIDTVFTLKEKQYNIICTGEMGIANTSTTALCAALLLDLDASKVTGRGAGLDDERLAKKKRVIAEGIEKYRPMIKAINDTPDRAFEVLRIAGGLDIAAMVGLYIGGALYHIPIVIDGVISALAAYIAVLINPVVSEYIIPSHMSREPVAKLLFSEENLNMRPIIDADLALGEGTGAVLLMPVLDMALSFFKNGLRFADIDIEKYQRFN